MFYPVIIVSVLEMENGGKLISTILTYYVTGYMTTFVGGAVAEWVRASTGDRTCDGSSPTSVKTFLFGTLAIPFTPLASVFRMRQ